VSPHHYTCVSSTVPAVITSAYVICQGFDAREGIPYFKNLASEERRNGRSSNDFPSLWPPGSNGAICSSRSGPPCVPQSSRSHYDDSREISGSYHDDSYRGIVGNDAVKMFRRHTVPPSSWQGYVCENASITDQDGAKHTARMADRFVFRFGADECSGNATNMAGNASNMAGNATNMTGKNESSATSVTSGQTEEMAANPFWNHYTVNITADVPIRFISTLYIYIYIYIHVDEHR
jgi:hypothetical protein